MKLRRFGKIAASFAAVAVVILLAVAAGAPEDGHIPIFLKDADGNVINPVTGENADKPYSPKQTCGGCHDYETISGGFHFQQGYDEMAGFVKEGQPWVQSPAMYGKW